LPLPFEVLRLQLRMGPPAVIRERDPVAAQEAEHPIDLGLPAFQVRRLAAVREAAVEADVEALATPLASAPCGALPIRSLLIVYRTSRSRA
jgi:hypothetical protein